MSESDPCPPDVARGRDFVLSYIGCRFVQLGVSDSDRPGSVADWIALCLSCGARPIGVRAASPFAVTVHHIRRGWIIVFSRNASQSRQCEMLAHELSEFLLATRECDEFGLLDKGDFKAWRHRVSQEVVKALFP